MWRRWRDGVVDWIWKRWHRAPQSPAGPARDWQSVQVHAEQLVKWLGYRWGEDARAYPDILTDYQGMCQDQGWHEHPWKTVAACLTSITTGRKVYERRFVEGRLARLRVYPVRVAQPDADAACIDAKGTDIDATQRVSEGGKDSMMRNHL